MIGIKVDFGDDLPKKLDFTRQLDALKAQSLLEARAVLEEEQRAGNFPEDPKDYQLFLLNRGRESRPSSLGTVSPHYLRIPYSLRWVSTGGGDVDVVRDAAIFAVETLRRRAPVFRGNYLASVSIHVGNRAVSIGRFRTMELRPTDLVAVGPDVKHASPIEAGYAKGAYGTEDAAALRGGVVRPVAQLVRDRFGAAVSARFVYVALGGARGGTMPAIDIGVTGAFAQNDMRPGASRRSRRRT